MFPSTLLLPPYQIHWNIVIQNQDFQMLKIRTNTDYLTRSLFSKIKTVYKLIKPMNLGFSSSWNLQLIGSFILIGFIANISQAQTTILETNFSSGLPAGWSNIDNGASGEVWQFNNPGSRSTGGNFDANFAILDSKKYGNGTSQDASLESAAFDASSYTSILTLEYDYQYRESSSSTAIVEVFNGSSWTTVKTYTGVPNYSSFTKESVDIAAAANGANNAKVRFTYTGSHNWWFMVDNVKITGEIPVDSDKDGVANSSDLDDDNDGIPDDSEGSCTTPDFASISTTGGGTAAINGASNLFGASVLTVTHSLLGTATQDDDDVLNSQTTGAYGPKFGVLNSTSLTNSLETTYSFSVPLRDQSFTLWDIDQTDAAQIKGFNGINPVTYSVTNLGSCLRESPTDNFTTLASCQVNVNGDVNHSVTVRFDGAVDKIVITYYDRGAGGGGSYTMTYGQACSAPDTDKDGVPDYLDLDSDNDGIPDLIEAGGIDINGDGFIDYPTPSNPTSMTDTDNDGLADAYDDNNGGTALTNPDTDGDGSPDASDLDSDNDGLSDLVEAGGVDTDGDGRADNTTDDDDDGFPDIYDADDDGTPGVEDSNDPLVKVGGDTNSDGFANDDSNNTYVDGDGKSTDGDGDGIPNNKDLDSDGDGIPDLVEAGGIDTNGDGKVEITTDADNDGLADIYDADDDGTPGVEDATDPLMKTGGTDTDNDGKADDAAITFLDGSGNSLDNDGDGLVDGQDKDSDNDGIVDILEVGGTDANNDGKVDAATDADGDGLADAYDENASDGPAGTGTNGTALVETSADSNADGKVNGNEAMVAGGGGSYTYINQDGDDEFGGIPKKTKPP